MPFCDCRLNDTGSLSVSTSKLVNTSMLRRSSLTYKIVSVHTSCDLVSVAINVDAIGTMDVGIKDVWPVTLGVTMMVDHTTVPLLHFFQLVSR